MRFERQIRCALLWGVALVVSACATPARQTEHLLKNPGAFSAYHEIPNVPFIQQTENYCGPATLAMAMNFQNHPATVEELGAQVFTPDKAGTLQSDLIGASRRNGMLAVEIRGLPALMEELQEGNPVIVLTNLGLSWYPKWHYSLAIGYDLNKPELIFHSGPDARMGWNMRKFERSWALADYWGLVVLPHDQLAVSAGELEHAAAGAGLEQVGRVKEAETVYRNILGRWPDSLSALIGLGNVTYARGAYQEAVRVLREATRLHPESSAAWHNLAAAEGAARMKEAARRSAARALELAPEESAAIYRESLKEWLNPENSS